MFAHPLKSFFLYCCACIALIIFGVVMRYSMQQWSQACLPVSHSESNLLKHVDLLENSKAFAQQKNYEQALECALQALKLSPNDSTTLELLGFLYLTLSNFEQALQCYDKVRIIQPSNAKAHYNYGYLSGLMCCEIQRAVDALKMAQHIEPAYPLAHTVLGETYLMAGHYEKAWPEFAWNWQCNYKPGAWSDVNFTGKKILLKDVQGFGDSIHFIRYLKLLKDKGAVTLLHTTCKALIPLYKRCALIDQIFTDESSMPAHDMSAPLLALPLLFNTTLSTIPCEIPYIKADQTLVTAWRKKLAADTKFKVGISWHSDHRCELTKPEVARKSILLKELITLLRVSGVSFYSLQKFEGTEELATLPADIKIHTFDDFDESHDRFMDTAALMQNMDLVISVDTVTAHLAGALGIPTWLALTFPADWRWMLDRHESPWYPTMRLFRRAKGGSWADVVATMEMELKKLLTIKIQSRL